MTYNIEGVEVDGYQQPTPWWNYSVSFTEKTDLLYLREEYIPHIAQAHRGLLLNV